MMTDVCLVGNNTLDKETVPNVFVPGVLGVICRTCILPILTNSGTPIQIGT
jgi:hypothetical protein